MSQAEPNFTNHIDPPQPACKEAKSAQTECGMHVRLLLPKSKNSFSNCLELHQRLSLSSSLSPMSLQHVVPREVDCDYLYLRPPKGDLCIVPGLGIRIIESKGRVTCLNEVILCRSRRCRSTGMSDGAG